MAGAAPQKYVRRRNARPEWEQLPAEHTGGVPEWPLRTDMSASEVDLWESLWRKPQAKMWSLGGYERVVARYVIVTVIAEDPSSPNAALLSEVRQLEDRLGLSPMAMKRLQWEVEPAADKKTELAEVTRIDRYANL